MPRSLLSTLDHYFSLVLFIHHFSSPHGFLNNFSPKQEKEGIPKTILCSKCSSQEDGIPRPLLVLVLELELAGALNRLCLCPLPPPPRSQQKQKSWSTVSLRSLSVTSSWDLTAPDSKIKSSSLSNGCGFQGEGRNGHGLYRRS